MLEQAIVFYTDPAFAGKMAVALRSVVVIVVFAVIFVLAYYRAFWKSLQARKLFWITSGILGATLTIKFVIGVLYKGYVPELILFYGIPSPKATGIGWLLAATGVMLVIVRYHERLQAWPRQKFLIAFYALFVILAVSIAAIREGLPSFADPYTRTYWEYSGNVPLIHNLKDFLHEYVILELHPTIAQHAETHPPGYSVLLYLFSKFFTSQALGLAFATVLAGGLVLWPLYYLWRELFSERVARRAIMVSVFIPSLTLMTATSTEALFMVLVWLSTATLYFGWKKSCILSLVGGLVAAVALFSNFLWLLLAPWYLWLAVRLARESAAAFRRGVLYRILISLLAGTAFFLVIYWWSGYSIVDNFFTARAANSHAVQSNFASLATYLGYFIMNISTFIFYFGIPLAFIFYLEYRTVTRPWPWIFKSGLALLAFFLAVGIFQGNVERLWLFILPFFVVFPARMYVQDHDELFRPAIALLFLQMILTHTLFYTYY